MPGLRAHSSFEGLHPAPPRAGSGIGVYAVEDIVERSATFQVAAYAPGIGLFGDDSGGRGFRLDPRSPGAAVRAGDLGDLDPADFEPVADDLASWIAQLAARTKRASTPRWSPTTGCPPRPVQPPCIQARRRELPPRTRPPVQDRHDASVELLSQVDANKLNLEYVPY